MSSINTSIKQSIPSRIFYRTSLESLQSKLTTSKMGNSPASQYGYEERQGRRFETADIDDEDDIIHLKQGMY